MKILSVTPIRVGADELTRRQDRYRRLAPPGVECVLEEIGADAPDRFATADDIAASTAAVSKALAAAPDDGFAFRMPDCVLDPAVPVTPDGTEIQTVGMLRLSAAHLVATGRTFGAVTRNRAIGDALAHRIEEYGFGPWFAGVTVLDLDFDAISDTARWNDAVRGALDGFAARGVRAVINGCSAVDTDTPHTVELVDPAALALRLLAAGGRA
ncbi:aspartate/glutamate racemase family protein [Streptomyces kunmingensis]|uniref:Aspartate/glutamate racemase family protein n=1 Tax=Streptomyces kunmingensis TaxID=68225 RepID=A0ABU6C7W1_9ACTN|nr:aspartate/glutamate racemase family protein [Streptomyces kunmingensis]MEB3960703.1 aspartate/glutamate racemase family protein [Streptomyces kunmingensis]